MTIHEFVSIFAFVVVLSAIKSPVYTFKVMAGLFWYMLYCAHDFKDKVIDAIKEIVLEAIRSRRKNE